jgi:hypothetical protein
MMEYIKHKITGALIVAFLFLSACNSGVEVVTEKAVEIIGI